MGKEYAEEGYQTGAEVTDQCAASCDDPRGQLPYHRPVVRVVDQELPALDPIQNNCHYGYVLPDRCRYWRHKGCPCGAYPAFGA